MMQWLNPWAWAGLAALAIPIAVHLFSRRPPRTVEFPSLRFLDASPLRPTRRSVLSDLPLLCVRMLLLGTAVLALAQPLWVKRGAPTRGGTGVAEGGATASTAMIAERRTPQNSTNGGATDHVSQTGDSLLLFAEPFALRPAVSRAVAWLRTRPSPRALVLRSSFPVSALDAADIAALPGDVRVTLIHEPPSPSAGPGVIDFRVARDTLQWITGLDARTTDEVVTAVHALGGAVVLPVDRSVVANGLRYPLLTSNSVSDIGTFGDTIAAPRRAPAVARLLAVASDRTIASIVNGWSGASADSTGHSPAALHFPLHFDVSGQPVLVGVVQGGQPVVIVRTAGRPTLATATLLAMSDNPVIRALRAHNGIDRDLHSAATISQWQSLPSGPSIGLGSVTDRHSTETWARWVWAAVLALAGVEWLMRRRS